MRLLFRVAALAVVLLGGGWAVLFCLANDAAVSLDLVILRLPEAPVAVWVLGAFVAGGVSGLLAASVALWRARLALLAARRAAARGAPDTSAVTAKGAA
jgi:uncharacterized integral membrane protein